MDIAGALDTDAMKAACAAVFRRHEQLRMRIAFDDSADDPAAHVQVVHPDRPDLFDEVFTEKHVADTSTLTEFTHAVAQRPFDVHGPLVRIALLTDGADRHRLVVVAHHLVLDRRSAAVVFRDVAGAYNACRGATPSFGEAGTPDYREFVARNTAFLAADADRIAEHWRAASPNADCRNLALGPAPEAAARGHDGVIATARADRRLRRELVELAPRVALVTVRRLPRRAARVATPVRQRGGRVRRDTLADARTPGFESLVGALVHSLPVVVDADGDTPFTELVARTASAWDGAWSDRELPLARIVEAVNLPRNQAVDPLFQVVLDFDDVDLVCPLTGLETAVDPLFPGGTHADLVFTVHDAGDRGLEMRLEAAHDLFDVDTAERILGHYLTLLGGVAADADRAVEQLPVVGPRERNLLVNEWNRTATEVAPASIHELFEAAAARTPTTWPSSVATRG